MDKKEQNLSEYLNENCDYVSKEEQEYYDKIIKEYEENKENMKFYDSEEIKKLLEL